MNRAEALKTAEEIVDRQAAKITDRNAFSNSTNVLALRVEQILKLADFLWEPEDEPGIVFPEKDDEVKISGWDEDEE
jgi:hypothetical protein